jgi:hypothetical protein
VGVEGVSTGSVGVIGTAILVVDDIGNAEALASAV